MANNQAPTLGNGKICYIEIPAVDPAASAEFYRQVFGWSIRKRGDGSIAFDDGVGEVSGTWVVGPKPIGEAGIVISIMVDDAPAMIEWIVRHGGTIVQPIGAHFPEITARFTDPVGNLWQIYQGR
jgi:predicted enzyme related to lactoylglutathione lyase